MAVMRSSAVCGEGCGCHLSSIHWLVRAALRCATPIGATRQERVTRALIQPLTHLSLTLSLDHLINELAMHCNKQQSD